MTHATDRRAGYRLDPFGRMLDIGSQDGEEVLEAAQTELISGPTPAEQNAGIRSPFDSADLLRSVTLAPSGAATIDLADDVIALTEELRGPCDRNTVAESLLATAFLARSDPRVTSVQISVNGDCRRFWELFEFHQCVEPDASNWQDLVNGWDQ